MKRITVGYQKLSTKSIALLGILTALQIILGRFTIGTNFLKVSFTFIIIVLIAKWFGSIWGCLVAIISDYLSITLSGGFFYFGFTISAITTMLIYSLFFYQREHISWQRTFLATLLVLCLSNTIMNTIWVSLLYNYSFTATIKLFEIRALKEIIMLFIQTPIIYLIINNQRLEALRKQIF